MSQNTEVGFALADGGETFTIDIGDCACAMIRQLSITGLYGGTIEEVICSLVYDQLKTLAGTGLIK